MFKQLAPLSLATFAIGTDGFVIAGLLSPIASDLHVGVAAAGQLVTVFALVYAASAAVLGALTSGLDRRTLLLGALTVFAIGNAATALGTSYAAVMAARVITAIGAGVIISAASSSAAALVEPERRGTALAVTMGGLSAASAIGLPLGVILGGADWRLTLWAVAALGLVAALGVAATFPALRLPAATLRDRVVTAREPWVVGTLTVSVLSLAALYMVFTYIRPALEEATGSSTTTFAVIVLAFGAALLAATLTSGRLVDRFGAVRVLRAGLAGQAVMLALAPLALPHLATAIIWLLAWGTANGSTVVPQQHRLVEHAPQSSPVLLGLNGSAIYVGIAAGGALGGLALGGLSATALGLPAAAIALAALGLTVITTRERHPALAPA